jgi:hypothetical protein
MGLESTTYIDGLVITNPAGSDPKSQGDDHIRLLKSAIKSTFPNVTGAVTPTHTELNYVDGVTSAIQTQLDTLDTGKLDDNVSVTERVLGRNTAGAGAVEEVTVSQLLDWAVGTPAQGDILYRGAANWTLLPAGTSGQYLKTQGSGANPTWSTAGLMTNVVRGQSVGTGTTYSVTTISGAERVEMALNGISFSGTDYLRMQLGVSGPTYITTGYVGRRLLNDEANASSWSSYAEINFAPPPSDVIHGIITLVHCGSNVWHISGQVSTAASANINSFGGYVTLSGALTAVQLSGSGGGAFDAGTCTINQFG